MAATFQWSEANGAGPVVTDGVANVNFGSNDSKEIVVATYPITAGTNSYEKYIKGKFAGTFTEISNMKFWKSAGAYVTGESLKVATGTVGAPIVYAAPVATASAVATSDIPTSEGTALAMFNDAGGATIVAADYTDYIVMQLQTTTGATAGTVNTKTFTFQYDEV